MRKILFIVFVSFLLGVLKVTAQITLDTIITPAIGFGYDFHTIQISKTETKYLFEDHIANTFSLYEMNFQPFMENIPLPEPFGNSYQVLYVSRGLFDCDSTNIEYVYASTTDGYKPFRIMRVDGTQLFKLDSAIGPHCSGGCLGYSDLVVPIRNTSSGTKLFLHHPPIGQTVNIYSLCGDLPTDVFDFRENNESVIKLFPNPSSSELTFQINLPDNINGYQLTILDNNAKEIIKRKVDNAKSVQFIDVSSMGSGAYFYSLSSENKTYKSGKFILTK